MKYTTWIFSGILILYGLFAALYAFTGYNLLLVLCFGKRFLYRAALSLAGVAALWLLFWLLAFRPPKFLS